MRVSIRQAMNLLWSRPLRGVLIEDPDDVGYRVVSDELLAVMDAAEWFRLEHAAYAAHRRELDC
jgi:hypothetical protein